MSFWTEHMAAEAEIKERNRAPQNVLVDECGRCGAVKDGVLFGTCAECFADWEASRCAT